MKNIPRLSSLIIFFLIISLASCTKENVYRGIYETTTQGNKIKRDSSGIAGQENPPSYGQYQLDRKKVID